MSEENATETRRSFLERAAGALMQAGLAVSYGALGLIGLRFVYPSRPRSESWLFVADLAGFAAGGSLLYRSPTGERITIARQGSNGDVGDFVALSSTCPHLGCQVHWQEIEDRFFCPCHNGAFDAAGKAIAGPPADGNQSLPRFELRVDNGILFIKVPTEGLA